MRRPVTLSNQANEQIMNTQLPTPKNSIEGAYTFISTDKLASQFVDVYLEMKNMEPSKTYRLYLSFKFLDSNASRILFRFLSILDACTSKPGFPRLKVTFLYDWKDEFIEELGLILADQFADSLNLKQIESFAA